MKRVYLFFVMVFSVLLFSGCKSVDNADNVDNASQGYLSISNFSSEDILVLGTYDELLDRMGEPEHYSERGFTAKLNDSLVKIPVMYYPGVQYCRRNDSVQLCFIDFHLKDIKLTMQSGNGHPLIIDKNTKCDDFYSYIDKYVLPGGDCLEDMPDNEKMSYDSHYFTEGLYYSIGFVSDTIDKKSGNIITPVFTPQDKKLWYILFSPIDMGGLYRNRR